MPATRPIRSLHALAAALLVATACAPSKSAGDSTATAAPGARAPNASVPNASVPDAPAPDAPPADTGRPPAATDSVRRPRLTPRPPHPVPRPMPRPESASAAAPGDTSDPERAAIDRLRREARALARADGCTAVAGCAVLPLGERPCGGPEEYVVYCARATDVPALERKAAALARAERAYNAKHEIMSTCEYRVAPVPLLVGGSCQAARSDGRATLPP